MHRDNAPRDRLKQFVALTGQDTLADIAQCDLRLANN